MFLPRVDRRRTTRLRNSIQLQLGLGALAVVVVAFAVSLGILTSQDERDFSRRHGEEARRIAAFITGDLSRQMLAGGAAEVWRDISIEAGKHGALTGASNVLVFGRDGRVKAASDTAQVGSRLAVVANPECPGCDRTRLEDFPMAATLSTSAGARRLRLVNAIPMLDQCRSCHRPSEPVLGYVSMDFDLTGLQRRAGERRNSMVVVELAAGVLLLLLMALLFRQLVMRSINALIVGAERLGSGELDARVKITGENELSLLARHFNRMAGRLQGQVARIQNAHTESTLLYTLVIEASKNLETAQVAASVARVVLDKLNPQYVAFFLATSSGPWICACGGRREQPRVESGSGELSEVLASDSAEVHGLLNGLPQQLLAEAYRQRSTRIVQQAQGFGFAIPVISDERLIGMLACNGVAAPVNEELLANLGAHLALAAANSLNYAGAITDKLTGFKNRYYGLARLDDAVMAAKRYGSALALVMCDIDHFKGVNDTYGHPAGDEVLREVARRIAAGVRKADITVRYGGDEFMLILPQATPDRLPGVGEKIRRAVEHEPVPLGAGLQSLAITVSVGIAAFDSDTGDGEKLIARADAALYRAKQAGRNRVGIG